MCQVRSIVAEHLKSVRIYVHVDTDISPLQTSLLPLCELVYSSPMAILQLANRKPSN
jgi:hypothetical protein